MQINSQSSYQSITSLDSKQQSSRLPVVYTSEEAEFVVEQSADTTQIVTPSAPVDEEQESRFVREFVSVDRNLGRHDDTSSRLPKAVQTYQAVSTLNIAHINGNIGIILDETV
jgi:hypothetical protein